MIRYEGKLYRPPSEAESLILQATIGCSYNRCTFCGMDREKRVRVLSDPSHAPFLPQRMRGL